MNFILCINIRKIICNFKTLPIYTYLYHEYIYTSSQFGTKVQLVLTQKLIKTKSYGLL